MRAVCQLMLLANRLTVGWLSAEGIGDKNQRLTLASIEWLKPAAISVTYFRKMFKLVPLVSQLKMASIHNDNDPIIKVPPHLSAGEIITSRFLFRVGVFHPLAFV